MRRTKYRFHPACTVFAPLADDELQELADDIAANGLRNPIVLWQGKILDGRNRYLACEMASVERHFIQFEGEDPIGWVVSQNLLRRHLTASQKAVVALDLLPMLEKEAKQRQRQSHEYRGNGRLAQKCANRHDGKGKAAETAARIVGVSARYVELAKEVKKKAPQLVQEVREGRLTIHVAAQLAENEVRRNGKPPKRAKINGHDKVRVACGDCRDLIPTLEDESIQLVLTSPPYAEQRKGQYKSVSGKKTILRGP